MLNLIKEKLNPNNFSSMSPKMQSILGYILETQYNDNSYTSLIVKNDILIADGNIIGDKDSLINNWNNLLSVSDLSESETDFVNYLFKSKLFNETI